MKLTYDQLRDYVMRISFDENEYIRIPYDGVGKETQLRAGHTLEVQALRVSADLITGDTSVLAEGYLVNKDGTAGERERTQYLTEDQIPRRAIDLIYTEVADKRREVAHTLIPDSGKGVKF